MQASSPWLKSSMEVIDEMGNNFIEVLNELISWYLIDSFTSTFIKEIALRIPRDLPYSSNGPTKTNWCHEEQNIKVDIVDLLLHAKLLTQQ